MCRFAAPAAAAASQVFPPLRQRFPTTIGTSPLGGILQCVMFLLLASLFEFRRGYAIAVLLSFLCEARKHWDMLETIAALKAHPKLAPIETTRTDSDARRLEWAAVTGRAGRDGVVTNVFGIPVPALGVREARVCLVVFYVAMTALATGWILPRAAALLALVSFSLAAPAFWQAYYYEEDGCQGHMCYPLLMALALLSLDDGDFGRLAIQLVVSGSYTGAGLAKLRCSYLSGHLWDGATLAFYLVNTATLRPLRRNSPRHRLTALALRYPAFLHFFALSSLLLECSVVVVVHLAPRTLGLCLLGLHLGIHLVMEINFLHCWGPSLLALLAGPAPFYVPQTLAQALVLGLAAIILLPALSLYDLADDAPEMAPFSCFPVFAHACRLDRDAHVMTLYPHNSPGPPIDPYYIQSLAASSRDRHAAFDLRAICERSPSNLVVVTDLRSRRQIELVANCAISDTLARLLTSYYNLIPKNSPPDHFLDLAVAITDEVANCDPKRGLPAVVSCLAW